MFIAALFTIVNCSKQPKCPSVNERIKKLWYIYTIEYYRADGRGGGGSFTINYYRKDSAFLFLEVPSPTPPPARFAMPAARGRTSLNARDW